MLTFAIWPSLLHSPVPGCLRFAKTIVNNIAQRQWIVDRLSVLVVLVGSLKPSFLLAGKKKLYVTKVRLHVDGCFFFAII